MTNKKLWEQFEMVEFSRGIKGILDDLVMFGLKCADDCKGYNDIESAKEYRDIAEKISQLIPTLP